MLPTFSMGSQAVHVLPFFSPSVLSLPRNPPSGLPVRPAGRLWPARFPAGPISGWSRAGTARGRAGLPILPAIKAWTRGPFRSVPFRAGPEPDVLGPGPRSGWGAVAGPSDYSRPGTAHSVPTVRGRCVPVCDCGSRCVVLTPSRGLDAVAWTGRRRAAHGSLVALCGSRHVGLLAFSYSWPCAGQDRVRAASFVAGRSCRA